MANTQLQLRKGNTAQTAIFTGAVAEVTVDTDKKTLIVHDGATQGGIEIAKRSELLVSFNAANSAGSYANGAFGVANSATINVAQADQKALSAGSYANSAYAQANTANNYAETAQIYAHAAYHQANSATTDAETAGDYANAAFAVANTINTGGYATQTYVNTAISNLVDSAPTTLDTLNELAAALGDDPNFATTISNMVGVSGGYANSAFTRANSAFTRANNATTDAATADQKAVSAGSYANSAFTRANTTSTALSSAEVKIGLNAGQTSQGSSSVAVGPNAGSTNQGQTSVAIGSGAGSTNQGISTIAIGSGAGSQNQSIGSVAVGDIAGYSAQGSSSIAIGRYAGFTNLGINSVVIGSFVAYNGTVNDSIVISAKGQTGKLGYTSNIINSGLYIDPIRTANAYGSILYHNPTTMEVTKSQSLVVEDGAIGDVYIANNIITPMNLVSGVYGTETPQSLIINGDLEVLGNLISTSSGSSFSGAYADLTGKPTIPTLVSQLTNDSGFITAVPNSSTQVSSLGVGTPASGTTGEIRATNNITAYYSSDRKLKENIEDIPNALDTVNHIGGKLFDWTDEYIQSHGGEDGYFINKQDFGVIAQDVQDVFPRAVKSREDGTLAVDYEKLCALAFAAIKELTDRINKLEGN